MRKLKKGGSVVVKKGQNGLSFDELPNKRPGRPSQFDRPSPDYTKKPAKKAASKVVPKKPIKAKKGTSLGMKSVKAGYDKNPGVTRADVIVAAKGKAKKGSSLKKAKAGISMTRMANLKKGGKCKYGC